MMWWNHDGWGAGDWLAMSLMMVVFWGLLIALIVWTVRSFNNAPARFGGEQSANGSADAVLAERFARGEIDEDEFAARRELLHSGTGRSAGGGAR
jgi:putative membrane protein